MSAFLRKHKEKAFWVRIVVLSCSMPRGEYHRAHCWEIFHKINQSNHQRAYSKFFLYGLINSPPILWRILSAWSQKIFVELQNLFSCLLQRHFELKMMLCSFDFRLALLWMCSTCTRWFSSQADIALDWNYRKDWSDTCRLRRYSFIPTRSVRSVLCIVSVP